MRGVLILWLCLLATPALAGEADEAAVRASEVQGEHCSQLIRESASLEAASLSVVAGALQQVAEAYETTDQAFLLYWRGVLAECIGYDDDARGDLLAFWNATEDDRTLATQRDDAARRLRRLGVAVDQSVQPVRAGLGIGVGLVAGGGVLAGLAGWQKAELEQAQTDYEAGDLLRPALQEVRERGEAAADATNALTGVSLGLAAGSLAAFVVQAVTDGTAKPVAWAPALRPRNQGAVVAVVGRW